MTHTSIQILADNRAENGLGKEHGLSIWIEVDGRKILFDTGAGKVLENNGTKICAIIGGFHLMAAHPLRLDLTMQALEPFEIDLLVPCHCTGQAAVELLKDTFELRVSTGAAGKVLQF